MYAIRSYYVFASAEEGFVDILDLSKECGADIRADYWKGIYELKKGRTIVRFAEGCPWYLLNMNELITGLDSRVTDRNNFV